MKDVQNEQTEYFILYLCKLLMLHCGYAAPAHRV